MGSLSRFLVSFFIFVYLQGCGGGSNDNNGTGNDASVRVVRVSVAQDLPAAVLKTITSIVSPTGTADSSGNITLPDVVKSQDTLVLALQNETPFMMAFTIGDMILTANTTADAMVRMALPEIYPSDVDLPVLLEKIHTAPSYSSLVARVLSSINQNASPITSEDVDQLVKQVATETGQLLEPQAVVKTTVELTRKPFPYYLMNVSQREKAWFDDSEPGSFIYFKNLTALAWEVSVRPPALPTATSEIAPARTEKPLQLINYYAGSESITPLMGMETRYTLYASQQSNAVKVENGVALLTSNFRLLLELTVKAGGKDVRQCSAFIAKAFANKYLPQLAAQQSSAAFLAYVKGAGSWSSNGSTAIHIQDVAALIWDSVQKCGLTDSEIERYKAFSEAILPPFVRAVMATYDIAKMMRSSISALDLSSQISTYFGKEYSATICRSYGATIPCRFTLTITPVAASIKKGNSTVFTARLADAADQVTGGLIAARELWRSDRPDIANVTNNTRGFVVGISPGIASITVERQIDANDPTSLISATANVTVTDTDPPSSPSAPTTASMQVAGELTRCSRTDYQVGYQNVSVPAFSIGCVLSATVTITCQGGCYEVDESGEINFAAPRYAVVEANETEASWNAPGVCGGPMPPSTAPISTTPRIISAGVNTIQFKGGGKGVVQQGPSPPLCEISGAKSFSYNITLQSLSDRSTISLSGSTGDMRP